MPKLGPRRGLSGPSAQEGATLRLTGDRYRGGAPTEYRTRFHGGTYGGGVPKTLHASSISVPGPNGGPKPPAPGIRRDDWGSGLHQGGSCETRFKVCQRFVLLGADPVFARGARMSSRGAWLKSLTPEQRSEVCRKGGLAASRDSQHMAEIGRKGGTAISANKAHMAEIGRKGGSAARKPKDNA